LDQTWIARRCVHAPGASFRSGKCGERRAGSGPRLAIARTDMMKSEKFAITNIYVPVKRRATLDPKKVQEIAESILQSGQQTPILVRQDGERFVLIEGLHRLEACKQLGEETILGYLVQARRH
jgi:sulfiredoxin